MSSTPTYRNARPLPEPTGYVPQATLDERLYRIGLNREQPQWLLLFMLCAIAHIATDKGLECRPPKGGSSKYVRCLAGLFTYSPCGITMNAKVCTTFGND